MDTWPNLPPDALFCAECQSDTGALLYPPCFGEWDDVRAYLRFLISAESIMDYTFSDVGPHEKVCYLPPDKQRGKTARFVRVRRVMPLPPHYLRWLHTLSEQYQAETLQPQQQEIPLADRSSCSSEDSILLEPSPYYQPQRASRQRARKTKVRG